MSYDTMRSKGRDTNQGGSSGGSSSGSAGEGSATPSPGTGKAQDDDSATGGSVNR